MEDKKFMKKTLITIIAVVVVASMLVASLAGCSKVFKKGITEKVELSEIKIGLICLHDKNSTYDKNFIEAMEQAQVDLGLKDDQVVIATGIPEGDECYQKACELAEAGCNIIMADSFGHEDYMIKAAKEYPTVLFAHATGTKAAETNLDNFVNAFAAIYEGRYLAGVVAGMKLQELVAAGKPAKVGYVGAYTYAEVISGYTSWFLGVKSIVPEVTMEVTFTGSWYDETAENTAANTLIDRGAVLISQHADSMGAPNACEAKNVPNVSYNGSTAAACPNTFLISSRINWTPYYTYLVECRQNGVKPDKDYVGTIATGSVQLTGLGTAVAAGTSDKLTEVKAQLAAGTLKVFSVDIANMTVGGQPVTTAKLGSTELVSDGYYHESIYRSAPSFDLRIDGITLLDEKY